MTKETVVRSTLRSPFKNTIEEIVQVRSRVQATGNLVFTKAILLAVSSGSLPRRISSQAFISACQRSVCVRKERDEPLIVEFEHADCVPYLHQAQAFVNERLTTFDSDKALTETFNQAAREYHTVLQNGIIMNFVHWQRKLLNCLLAKHSLEKAAKIISRLE